LQRAHTLTLRQAPAAIRGAWLTNHTYTVRNNGANAEIAGGYDLEFRYACAGGAPEAGYSQRFAYMYCLSRSQPQRGLQMPMVDLAYNGDFSEMFADWILTGVTANTQVVEESGRFFAYLGRGVVMYQDINVNPGWYDMAFELRAPYPGNGVRVRLQGLDAAGQPVQTLLEQSFGEAADWTPHAAKLAIPFNRVRLVFDAFSHAQIGSVQLLASFA
jgi:hypothetical protein